MDLKHNGENRSHRWAVLRGDGWGRAVIQNKEKRSEFEYWIIVRSSYGNWITTKQTTREESLEFATDLIGETI